MLTLVEKLAAQACVNASETGSARGNYSAVAVIPGDAGHLTYGRSQTTLASGGLYKLVSQYCAAPAAQLAAKLKPYLPRLEARDLGLDTDRGLKELLREAGKDPVMQQAQDAYFDHHYWEPAVRAAASFGLNAPLSIAVVYDSHIHGSWVLIRDRTFDRHGKPDGSFESEKLWIERYVALRRSWFSAHGNAILRRAVARMDAFKALIAAGNWGLELPFRFRGVLVDAESLELDKYVDMPLTPLPTTPPKPPAPADTPPTPPEPDKTPPPADDAEPSSRVLQLTDPMLSGEDVEELQRALTAAGFELDADGDFGPLTDKALRDFQEAYGLEVTGIVDEVTREALELSEG